MSLKTDNFKLYKYEDNDIGDLRFINDSMDIIDKGINPFYVATQSSTNVYKITTGLNKTVLNDGYSIKVAIPSNSTGAVSITVDSVTVPVKKPNGNAVTNFKQNGVYSLTYYNSVFILASGGVDDVSFSASDLLTGKTANDSNGEKVNGTMPNKGAVTASLNCGGSYTIPAGYHNGSGKVTANSLKSQTSANATAKDIIKGKTAWVNGSKLTGTATIQSLGGAKMYKYENYTTLSRVDIATINIPYAMDIVLIYAKGTAGSFRCLYSCMLGTLSVGIGSTYGSASYSGYSISKLSDTSFKITTGGYIDYTIDVYGFKL